MVYKARQVTKPNNVKCLQKKKQVSTLLIAQNRINNMA